MSPIDVTALLCGIPFVLSAGAYGGFDFLRVRRMPCEGDVDVGTVTTRPPNRDVPLQVIVARTPEHFSAVHDLVRSRYAWRGYGVSASVREERAERSRQEVTFLVASSDNVIGTLTLGLDGPTGLLAEHTYHDVIGESRSAEHRVCELTRLALAEDIDSRTVLAVLFSLAHAVGRALHDVTHAFIEVNPRHVEFYCKVLGFAIAAKERFCERVRAPSVLLKLEVAALEKRIQALDLALQPLAKAA